MGLTILCPKCEATHENPGGAAARMVQCNCGTLVWLPAAEPGPEPPVGPATAAVAPAGVAPQRVPPARSAGARGIVTRAMHAAMAPQTLEETGFWAGLPAGALPDTAKSLRERAVRWRQLREELFRFLDRLALPVVAPTHAEIESGQMRRPLTDPNCGACGGKGRTGCTSCGGARVTDTGAACAECRGAGVVACPCVRIFAIPIPPHAVSGYVSRGVELGAARVRYFSLVSPELSQRHRPREALALSVLALVGGVGAAAPSYIMSPQAVAQNPVTPAAIAGLLMIIGAVLALLRKRSGWVVVGIGQLAMALGASALLLRAVVATAGLPLSPWSVMVALLAAAALVSLLTIPIVWSFRWWQPVVRGRFFPLSHAHRCFGARLGPKHVRLIGLLCSPAGRRSLQTAAALYLVALVLALALPSGFRLGQAWLATVGGRYTEAGQISATALEAEGLPKSFRQALGSMLGLAAIQAASRMAADASAPGSATSTATMFSHYLPAENTDNAGAVSSALEHLADLPPATAQQLPQLLGQAVEVSLAAGDAERANALGGLLLRYCNEDPVSLALAHPTEREWRFAELKQVEEKKKVLSEKYQTFYDGGVVTRDVYTTAPDGFMCVLVKVSFLHVGKAKPVLVSSNFALKADAKTYPAQGIVEDEGYRSRHEFEDGDTSKLVRQYEATIVFVAPQKRESAYLQMNGRNLVAVPMKEQSQ